jgi:hypothetical protein
MSAVPIKKFRQGEHDMVTTAFDAWARNTQAIAAEVANYSKKSFENSAAAFEKLIGAKSPEKAMEVQTEYLRSAYEELVLVTAKISELYADLARTAYIGCCTGSSAALAPFRILSTYSAVCRDRSGRFAP